MPRGYRGTKVNIQLACMQYERGTTALARSDHRCTIIFKKFLKERNVYLSQLERLERRVLEPKKFTAKMMVIQRGFLWYFEMIQEKEINNLKKKQGNRF